MSTPKKRAYDSTVARIAGNIVPGLLMRGYDKDVTAMRVVTVAVDIAFEIVAEVERRTPRWEDVA